MFDCTVRLFITAHRSRSRSVRSHTVTFTGYPRTLLISTITTSRVHHTCTFLNRVSLHFGNKSLPAVYGFCTIAFLFRTANESITMIIDDILTCFRKLTASYSRTFNSIKPQCHRVKASQCPAPSRLNIPYSHPHLYLLLLNLEATSLSFLQQAPTSDGLHCLV